MGEYTVNPGKEFNESSGKNKLSSYESLIFSTFTEKCFIISYVNPEQW